MDGDDHERRHVARAEQPVPRCLHDEDRAHRHAGSRGGGKAQREYDTANGFAAAGVKELNQAAGDLRDFRNDYLKESAELGAEKASLLQYLGLVSHTAVEVVEVTAFYVGIGVTIEELYTKIIPAVREGGKLSDEADRDFKRAEQWAKQGDTDLKQALAHGPCLDPVEGRLNKLLDDRKLEDQARTLIDSWENNGYRYVDPVTGEVLDEGAALKRARRDRGGARTPQVPGAARGKIKANAAEIRAALAAVGRALAAHGKARDRPPGSEPRPTGFARASGPFSPIEGAQLAKPLRAGSRAAACGSTSRGEKESVPG